MGLLQLVFWNGDNISIVRGHSFEDVKGKLYARGVVVPAEHLATRKTLRKYLEDVTGKSVSLSRAEFPYGKFWFDKGFRSFQSPIGGLARMVRVSVCVAKSLRGEGTVLDDLATVSAFRAKLFYLFENMSDVDVLVHVQHAVYAESVNNVFLIDSTVLPR